MNKYEAPSIEFYVFEMPESIMDTGCQCDLFQCGAADQCYADINIDIPTCPVDGGICGTDGLPCITHGGCIADLSY